MAFDRRNFLVSAPLMALAVEELASSLQGGQSLSGADQDALNFWVHSMGLPHQSIPAAAGIEANKGGQSKGNALNGSVDFEPLFLHYHEESKTLLTSDQIDPKDLAPSGDAQVGVQMVRMRFNSDDLHRYSKYTSGGIYMDMQQHPELSAPADSGFVHMATSVFSAFTTAAGQVSAGKGNSKSAKKQKNPVGNDSAPASVAAPADGAPAGKSVALQSSSQSQSLTLANGAGKAMFVAFVKDPKQSAFGQLISAMASQSTAPYAQLLSIPFLASPALTAIRTLVANLQLHGSNQAVVMQSTPLDLVATSSAAQAQGPVPLRVRQGSYIAVPTGQASALKSDMSSLKIWNGHLVPKDATAADINDDLISKTAPYVSYLSLGMNVTPVQKGSGCTAAKPKSS